MSRELEARRVELCIGERGCETLHQLFFIINHKREINFASIAQLCHIKVLVITNVGVFPGYYSGITKRYHKASVNGRT